MASPPAFEWCGGFGPGAWLPGGRGVSPCYQETASAAALLLLGAPLLALASRRRGAAVARAGPCNCTKGMTGGETTYLALALCLSAIHLVHFLTAAFTLRDLPFHVAYHAALCGLWAAVAAAQRRAATVPGRRPALRLLPLAVAGLLVYL
jgi:hypothetical protein